MHLSFCSTVLLFAMPGSERLLPYKAFRVLDYLRKKNKRKVAESQSLFLTTENTKEHENISFILCISCSGKRPQIFWILGMSITSASDKIPLICEICVRLKKRKRIYPIYLIFANHVFTALASDTSDKSVSLILLC